MNLVEKNQLVFRILTGELRYKGYRIIAPSIKILERANDIYQNVLYRHSFENEFLTQADAFNILVQKGIINTDIDKTIDNLIKSQDDLKVLIYKNFIRKESVKKLKTSLIMIKNKINDLYSKKHMLDTLTIDGYAIMVKNQFILMHCVYKNKQKLWKKTNDVDYLILNNLMDTVNNAYIQHEVLRELARTEPWRTYWINDKQNALRAHSTTWNDEQRLIVSYSKMYDNIYENSDCPSDEVINDDDALDGWMIKLRKDREKNKKEAELDNTLGEKFKDHEELYLTATNQEEAQEVFDLNSDHMRQVKNMRDKALKERGVLTEAELPDRQLERMVHITRE